MHIACMLGVSKPVSHMSRVHDQDLQRRAIGWRARRATVFFRVFPSRSVGSQADPVITLWALTCYRVKAASSSANSTGLYALASTSNAS